MPLPLHGTGNPSFWRSLVEGRQHERPINPITEAQGCKGWEEGELRGLGLAGGMTQPPRPVRPGALPQPSSSLLEFPRSSASRALVCNLGVQIMEQPHPKSAHTPALRAFAAGANSYTCVWLVVWPESGHRRHCWRRRVKGTQTPGGWVRVFVGVFFFFFFLCFVWFKRVLLLTVLVWNSLMEPRLASNSQQSSCLS